MIQFDLLLVGAPLAQSKSPVAETSLSVSPDIRSKVEFKLIELAGPQTDATVQPQLPEVSIDQFPAEILSNVSSDSEHTLSQPPDDPETPTGSEPKVDEPLPDEEPEAALPLVPDWDEAAVATEPDAKLSQLALPEKAEAAPAKDGTSLSPSEPTTEPAPRQEFSTPTQSSPLADFAAPERDVTPLPVLSSVPSSPVVNTTGAADDLAIKGLLSGSKPSVAPTDRGSPMVAGQVLGQVPGQVALPGKASAENPSIGASVSNAPPEVQNAIAARSEQSIGPPQSVPTGGQSAEGKPALITPKVIGPMEGVVATSDVQQRTGHVEQRPQVTTMEGVKSAQPNVPNALPITQSTVGTPQAFQDIRGNFQVAGMGSADPSSHALPGLNNDAFARAAQSVDPSTTLSTLQRTKIADVARQLAHSIPDLSARALPNAVELSLAPQELGRVRMLFSMQEGGISVLLQSERPETLDLMKRNIGVLQSELGKMGFEGFDFTFGQQGSSRWQDGTAEWLDRFDKSKDPEPNSVSELDEAGDKTPRPDRYIADAESGRIDIYL